MVYIQKEQKGTNCICGSPSSSVQFESDSYQVSGGGRRISFKILKCKQCHLCRTSPIPGANIGYQREGSEILRMPGTENNTFILEASAKHRLKRLKPYLDTSSNVLEIGCAAGELVESINRYGVRRRLGIDASRRSATIAKQLGRNVKCGFLHELEFMDGEFDVVNAHHVFEHIYEIDTVLVEVHRVIKAGGVLFLTVPNYRSMFARLKWNTWIGWHPEEHFWHFSKITIIDLLKRSGFSVVKMYCPMVSHNSEKKGISQIVKNIIALFRIGDTVEIIAKRL